MLPAVYSVEEDPYPPPPPPVTATATATLLRFRSPQAGRRKEKERKEGLISSSSSLFSQETAAGLLVGKERKVCTVGLTGVAL